jgi:phosphate transport system protein
MSLLEKRLEHDLLEIRESVRAMALAVEKELESSFIALQTADEKLAFSTILSDLPINRRMRHIDKLCHAFIAVHLPSAGHLRLISSVIRANIILERIGDYAVTIARESVQLGSVPEGRMATDINRISSEVMLVLRESTSAFNNLNAERARSAMKLANQVEHNMDGIYAALLKGSDSADADRRADMISLILFSQLKRVADQSKNLCEETIFIETGQTKQPKVYRIQFIDADNSCLGPMAELISRKIFPDSGIYSSAGVKAAKALNADMVTFMQNRSFELADLKPKTLVKKRESLAEYHVLIGLNQSVHEAVGDIPFRTSALNWEESGIPQGNDEQAWEELYTTIALQIRELMSLLRGEESI